MYTVSDAMQKYSFFELWSVWHFLFVLVVGFLYLKYIPYFWNKANIKGHNKNFKPWMHKGIFLSGLVVYFFSEGSPLQTLTHDGLYSLKITQETITYFFVAPMVLFGISTETIRPLLWHFRTKKLLKMLTNPIVAQVIFYTSFYIYHIPNVYTKVITNGMVGLVWHVFLFTFSLFLWWPVLSKLPELYQLSLIKKAIYIVMNNLFVIGSLVPLFLYDAEAYRITEIYILEPSRDFFAGAAILVASQKIIYGVFIGVIVHQWFKREDHIDPPNVAGALGVKNYKTDPGGSV